ncbi:glycoprotease pgp1 [Plectosphaerella plurivora]|uniref:Glycoprotease pgp1 n=1 Tax=Plectosphaerella plurivora TaxID=936078 RepID=A0A9P9AFJ8_9PEZI|nr:glycoprotease pgp1 [Plectosphaerella plurivora]
MRLTSRRPGTWLQARGQICLARRPRQCHPCASLRHETFSATARAPRSLLTLAIETSCDDTCVALLSKHADGSATLHYNKKHTSDNRECQGVNPVVAVGGHIESLGGLVAECLPFLPDASPEEHGRTGSLAEDKTIQVQGRRKQKPDFISVTRGPGMLSNLTVGLMAAKGLATAWQVPLLAVNHMQAHALTPQLITAMEKVKQAVVQKPGEVANDAPVPHIQAPAFPFLSLLVSGGHTLLVNSRGLNDHRILASALTLAVGDALDKAARFILPPDVLSGTDDVMYGRVLESFAFPTDGKTPPEYNYQAPKRRVDEMTTYVSPYGWKIMPPMQLSRRMAYEFAGIGSVIKNILDKRPDMPLEERRFLAQQTMRMMFEHLASRVIFALDDPALGLGGKTTTRRSQYKIKKDDEPEEVAPLADPAARVKTLVVSGGVASNRFLMHVLRSILDVRGYSDIKVIAPPPALCTDNAAMIAWTGMEMYEAGYASELTVTPIRRWPLDPTGEDGGILGVDGWNKRT